MSKGPPTLDYLPQRKRVGRPIALKIGIAISIGEKVAAEAATPLSVYGNVESVAFFDCSLR